MLRRSLLVLALCVSSTAAADGIYVTESFGGADVKNELGSKVDNAIRIKFSIGYRFGNFALEGFMAGDLGLDGADAPAPTTLARCGECGGGGGGGYGSYHHTPSLVSMGLDLKYIKPLSRRLEVYMRGSLSKAWLEDSADDYAGRGLGLGAGVQLEGKVPALGFLFWPLFFTNFGPKVTAALFVDVGTDFYRLHRDGDFDSGSSIDASMNRFTIGWAVGSDF